MPRLLSGNGLSLNRKNWNSLDRTRHTVGTIGAMGLTDEQVHQFNEAGAVTIDTPLTAQQIADAGAAMDRLLPYRDGHYRVSRTCDYDDPAIIDIIQHPFFEEVARQVLEADAVHFFQTAIVNAYPELDVPFSFWQHVDIQYRLSDFEARPKRILCSFFLWLTDVNEKRAPMMVRPGSHLLLAHLRENDPAWTSGPAAVTPCSGKGESHSRFMHTTDRGGNVYTDVAEKRKENDNHRRLSLLLR